MERNPYEVRSFDKTLPKESLQMYWISLRFYEMGGKQVLRGKKGRDLKGLYHYFNFIRTQFIVKSDCGLFLKCPGDFAKRSSHFYILKF